MPRFLSATLLLLTPLFSVAADPVKHRFIAADGSRGHVAVIDDAGKVEWEFANKHDVHDIQVLANGNILTHTSPTKTVEVSPKKEIVWSYESTPKDGYNGRIEVHAFQRLADGNTMIAESGNCRIIEVSPAGNIVKDVPLTVTKVNAHRDTRMVRKLDNGHYLVCHEGEGCVREYDDAGRHVWEYKLELGDRKRADGHGPEGYGVEVYGAIRLPNGNTLIGGGNNHTVLEVTPKGEVVWKIGQKDLPGITLAWVTNVQVLPNGNIVFGNCHAGPENPQIIEVTREKQVVWTFKDHKIFGNNLVVSQLLGVTGKVVR